MNDEIVLRKEDRRLVCGAGRFVDDIRLPNHSYIAFVRSRYPAAKISHIDFSQVREMQGILGAFTIADLPELRGALPAPVMNAMPIKPYKQSALAEDVVRFVGEALAVIVATDPYIAADAVDQVDVIYEPIPAVVDVECARKPESPLVHPEWGTNIAGEIEVETGNIESALAQSDLVVEERFEIGRMSGLPLETRGVVASWDPTAHMLTIWTSTQMPYGVREYIANALQLPRTMVRVIAPDVGGGFGPKGAVYAEDIVASALSRRLCRPVKWTETRHESFMATVHGHDQVHQAKLGLTKDGQFMVLEDFFLIDNGAYFPRGGRTANNVVAHLMGPYRFSAFRCRGQVISTNKTSNMPFRGAGRIQATFITDRLIHIAASKLGMDPVDLKRKNLLGPQELPFDRRIPYRPGLPVIYDSGNYPALMDAAEKLIGYREFRSLQVDERRKNGRLLGCAITPYTEGTGVPPAEGAMISIAETGQITVAIGAPSQGQSHETTMAQICAEQFGVAVEQITVVAGDTARFPASPVSSGTFASRIAAIAAPAIAIACEDVKEKARKIASKLLECNAEDLVVRNGRVEVAGAPASGIPLAEVARAARGVEFLGEQAEPGLSATRYFSPSSVTWASGAHAAIVEVCAETGVIQVLKYVVAHDPGREINKAVVEGQVHGGVTQGLGAALLEEIVYDNEGQLLTASLMDYCLPRARSFPAIQSISLPTPSGINALGIKGVGEGGVIPGQALIANAVADALEYQGVELNHVPLRQQQIRRAVNRGCHEHS